MTADTVMSESQPPRALWLEQLRELHAKGATTDVPSAAPFFGVGGNKAYELIKSGEWPTRVLRMGKKLRIPVSDIARELGVEL